jgi:hypothetical protein
MPLIEACKAATCFQAFYRESKSVVAHLASTYPSLPLSALKPDTSSRRPIPSSHEIDKLPEKNKSRIFVVDSDF